MKKSRLFGKFGSFCNLKRFRFAGLSGSFYALAQICGEDSKKLDFFLNFLLKIGKKSCIMYFILADFSGGVLYAVFERPHR